MKILCTADVHIGRRSSRLPSGIDGRLHSTAEAWMRIADRAVSERVDVVAVSGDLVDQANRYFEAIGALERGLDRLRESGAVTVMVGGNHDHDVLPLLVDRIGSPDVRLLGRGGRWERTVIERGGMRLNVDGWSFPAEHHGTSPMATYSAAPDRAPVLALLHGDLDQPASRYAPVALAELRRNSDVFFLLGHVHAPRRVSESGGAQLLYAGSPQALDPGEAGVHGAHLLEIDGRGFTTRFLPLSTVQYETVEVDIAGAERVEEVDARISRRVSERLVESGEEAEHLRHLSCRIRLVGATRLHSELDHVLLERSADLDLVRGEVRGSIESIETATRADRDLDALAAGTGSPALLARLIRDLQQNTLDSAGEQLLLEASRAAREMTRASPYLEIMEVPERPPAVRDAEARRELHRSATILLDELLAQKEPLS